MKNYISDLGNIDAEQTSLLTPLDLSLPTNIYKLTLSSPPQSPEKVRVLRESILECLNGQSQVHWNPPSKELLSWEPGANFKTTRQIVIQLSSAVNDPKTISSSGEWVALPNNHYVLTASANIVTYLSSILPLDQRIVRPNIDPQLISEWEENEEGITVTCHTRYGCELLRIQYPLGATFIGGRFDTDQKSNRCFFTLPKKEFFVAKKNYENLFNALSKNAPDQSAVKRSVVKEEKIEEKTEKQSL